MVCSTCESTQFDASKYLEILLKARILTDSFLAFKGPDMSFACDLLSDGLLTGRALESNKGIYKYAVVSGITVKGSAYLLQLQNDARPHAMLRNGYDRMSDFVASRVRRFKLAFAK